MEWVEKFLQIVAGYAVRWRTRGGLLRVAAVLLPATWEATNFLRLPRIAFAFTGPSVLIVWFVIWLIASGRIPLPPRGRKIVFAIDVEVEAERNFRRVFRNLVTTVESFRLSEPITIRRIAPDIVQNNARAEWYLDNFGVAQVIWGRALAGKANNEQIQKYQVYWTQRLPPGVQVNVNAVLSDLTLLEHGRKWSIAEVNDLIDVEVMSEDFLEISLAILAIRFLLENKLDNAAALFGRVVAGLEQHAKQSSERRNRFREIFQSVQLSVAAEAHNHGQHEKAVAILENLLPKYPGDVEYRLTLARAYFLAGNSEGARRTTNDIVRLDRNHPAVFANLAFFSILDRKYKRAGEWYAKLMKSEREKLEVLTSVSEFLEERYEEQPEEHAFLYGMAVVNGLLDPAILHSDLCRFLDVTSGKAEYQHLRNNAQNLLRQQRK